MSNVQGDAGKVDAASRSYLQGFIFPMAHDTIISHGTKHASFRSIQDYNNTFITNIAEVYNHRPAIVRNGLAIMAGRKSEHQTQLSNGHPGSTGAAALADTGPSEINLVSNSLENDLESEPGSTFLGDSDLFNDSIQHTLKDTICLVDSPCFKTATACRMGDYTNPSTPTRSLETMALQLLIIHIVFEKNLYAAEINEENKKAREKKRRQAERAEAANSRRRRQNDDEDGQSDAASGPVQRGLPQHDLMGDLGDDVEEYCAPQVRAYMEYIAPRGYTSSAAEEDRFDESSGFDWHQLPAEAQPDSRLGGPVRDIVSEGIAGLDTYLDFHKTTGILFTYALYTNSVALADALDYHFRVALLKLRKPRRFEGSSGDTEKDPFYVAFTRISSWSAYKRAALTYITGGDARLEYTVGDVDDLDSMPHCSSVLHPQKLFNRRTALQIVERICHSVSNTNQDLRMPMYINEQQYWATENTFACPELAYEWPRATLNCISMYYTVLPRTLNHKIAMKDTTLNFDTVIHNMKSSRDVQDPLAKIAIIMFNNMTSANSDAFDIIRQTNEAYLGDAERQLRDCKKWSEFRVNELRRLIAGKHVGFMDRAWVGTDFIGKRNRLVQEYVRHIPHWTSSAETFLVNDPNLSSFANRFASLAMMFESHYKVIYTHKHMMFLVMACLGAYLREHTLHFNLIMTGDGAVGKSYMQEILKGTDRMPGLFIPDTIDSVAYESEKAGTSGEENDHHNTFMDEGSSVWLFGGNNGAPSADGPQTGSTMLKERLSNCKTTVVILVMDKTRVQRKYTTSVTGTNVLMTNESTKKMEKPMKTRCFFIPVHDERTEGRTVRDVQKSKLKFTNLVRKDDATLDKAGICRDWFRMAQTMQIMVENGIANKTFPEPNLGVGLVFTDICFDFIQKRYCIGWNENRDAWRFAMALRTWTIFNACDRYANSPCSGKFMGEISYTNLMSIGPYLVCTRDIAVTTLSMFFHSIMKWDHVLCLEALLTSFCAGAEAGGGSGGIGVSQGQISQLNMDENQADPRPLAQNGYYESHAVVEDQAALVRRVVETTGSAFFPVKMSARNVDDFIDAMMKPDESAGTTNEPILQFDEKRHCVRFKASYIDRYLEYMRDDEMNSFRFRVKKPLIEIFKEVVDFGFNFRNQKPFRAITSIPVSIDKPYLFHTVEVRCDSERILADVMNGTQSQTSPKPEVPKRSKKISPKKRKRGKSATQGPVDDTDPRLVQRLGKSRVFMFQDDLYIDDDLQDVVYRQNLINLAMVHPSSSVPYNSRRVLENMNIMYSDKSRDRDTPHDYHASIARSAATSEKKSKVSFDFVHEAYAEQCKEEEEEVDEIVLASPVLESDDEAPPALYPQPVPHHTNASDLVEALDSHGLMEGFDPNRSIDEEDELQQLILESQNQERDRDVFDEDEEEIAAAFLNEDFIAQERASKRPRTGR